MKGQTSKSIFKPNLTETTHSKVSRFLRITTVYSKQGQKTLPLLESQEKKYGKRMQIR